VNEAQFIENIIQLIEEERGLCSSKSILDRGLYYRKDQIGSKKDELFRLFSVDKLSCCI